MNARRRDAIRVSSSDTGPKGADTGAGFGDGGIQFFIGGVSIMVDVADGVPCDSFLDPNRSRILLSLLRFGKLRKKRRFSFFLLVGSARVSVMEGEDTMCSFSVESGTGLGGKGLGGKGG